MGEEKTRKGLSNLRWFFAILSIFLGAFLFSLSIDQMGNIGHIIMRIIGLGCFFMAGFVVKGKMKKSFNTLDKIQVIFAVTAALLAILVLTNDSYYWSLKIVYILVAINLIIGGTREFRKNKKSLYAYCIIVMALLIIFLSIFP